MRMVLSLRKLVEGSVPLSCVQRPILTALIEVLRLLYRRCGGSAHVIRIQDPRSDRGPLVKMTISKSSASAVKEFRYSASPWPRHRRSFFLRQGIPPHPPVTQSCRRRRRARLYAVSPRRVGLGHHSAGPGPEIRNLPQPSTSSANHRKYIVKLIGIIFILLA